MTDVRIGKSRVYASDLGLGTNAVGGHNLFPNLNDETGKKSYGQPSIMESRCWIQLMPMAMVVLRN